MDWNLLFGFEGRVNRAKCWSVTLINSVCTVIFLLFVPYNIIDTFMNTDRHRAMPLMIAAIGCKRLHDRNKSGWCMVPFFVLPILLDKAAEWPGAPNVDFFFALVAFGINIWAFVEIFCLKGTKGPNVFGPDPLARARQSINTASGAAA